MSFDAPCERDLGAAFLAHEAGETARKLALIRLGKGLVQHFGNGKTEDAIAEEFEPLVGLALASGRRADMGEGRRDQLAIRENMPDALLERHQIRVWPRHPISRF